MLATARSAGGGCLTACEGGFGVRVVGVCLLLVGGLTLWRMTHQPGRFQSRQDGPVRARSSGNGRYRAGPWPGLSPDGGLVLVGCALLLAGGQLALGEPREPFPDLVLLGILAVLPMVLATRLVRAPGVASAVCGAYLLPRALVSLVEPGFDPPPLLLVPALAFDLSAWLRASDLAVLSQVTGALLARTTPRMTPRVTPRMTPRVTPGLTPRVTPRVTPRAYAGGRRRGLVGPRRCGRVRLAVAGAIFGGVLAAIEPAFAVLLGGDPATWSGPSVAVAGVTTALACAIAGLAGASGRDTEA